MTGKVSQFNFLNSYADNLIGLYKESKSDSVPSPKMLLFNYELAEELNLDPFTFNSDDGLSIFSGNKIPPESTTIAQAYAITL